MLSENVPASLEIADTRWLGEAAQDLDPGKRQERALRGAMSALPLKADMCAATWDVRFGPKVDFDRGELKVR
jgi:hypothetical protein